MIKLKKIKSASARIAIGLIAAGTTGCVVGESVNYLSTVGTGTFEKIKTQRAVEKVARQWCLTIRGSQIIPVYPLDEDIQVGDTYIVDTPVVKLKRFWIRHGYLPIEHRFARIHLTGYKDYYKGAYGVADDVQVPHQWQFPRWSAGDALATDPYTAGHILTDEEKAKRAARINELYAATDWPRAPKAGFPSFGFQIKRGESFAGALPVQGIPVMLTALGAREVKGNITITDAYTYGIDEPSLRRQVKDWAEKHKKELKSYFRPIPPEKEGQTLRIKDFNCLRVVSRVYLARSVDISMINTEASAWKGSAGNPKTTAAIPPLKNAGDNTAAGKDDNMLEVLKQALGSHTLEKEGSGTVNKPAAVEGAGAPGNQGPAGAGGDPAILIGPAEGPSAVLLPEGAEGEMGAAGGGATGENQDNAFDKEIKAKKKEMEQQRQLLALEKEQVQLDEDEKKLKDEKYKKALQRTYDLEVQKRLIERQTSNDLYGGYVVPGGTLTVTSSTSRSISMHETFGRPLVIGFHALEFAILPDGKLSEDPVTTFKAFEFNLNPAINAHDSNTVKKWFDDLRRDKKNR